MNDTAIHLENLAVRTGRRTILAADALRIGRGEMVGLLGPNGAGKSTLLRCLLGMQGGVQGMLSVLGERVDRLGSGNLARLRRRIGYVPQLLPTAGEMPLTVREVVAIGRTGLAGLLRPLGRQDWRIIDEWIGRLGLAPLAGRGFGQISGGEQRKTLIARAMAQQPELLLLDEPTANLDLGWRERMVATIHELYNASGLTVVLVCHELEVLPPGCDRVVLLDAGRLVADGPPEAVLSAERVAALYGPGLGLMRSGGRWAVVPAQPALTGETPHA